MADSDGAVERIRFKAEAGRDPETNICRQCGKVLTVIADEEPAYGGGAPAVRVRGVCPQQCPTPGL